MRSILILSLLVLTTAIAGQDATDKPPAEITLPALEMKCRPQKADDCAYSLKIQNHMLQLNLLASQLQTIQQQFDALSKEKLPALVREISAANKLSDDYQFDYQSLSFKLKKAEPTKKESQ